MSMLALSLKLVPLAAPCASVGCATHLACALADCGLL
ncbi:Uncharacterised protein [Mycobacterium tuberculosis]|nr:Uncharacterised protein [Mycobacterium tuberculosis]